MPTSSSVVYLYQGGTYPIVHAVENDTGRTLKMVIADETLPSGCTGKLYFSRPDHSKYNVNATLVLADNAFTADITQCLTRPGKCDCQLKITMSNKIVSTRTFIIDVQKSTSTVTVAQLGYTIENIQDFAERAEAAAAAAEAAEQALTLDTTLTYEGQAADAKATGDSISDVRSMVEAMCMASYTELVLPSLLSEYYVRQVNGDDAPSANWSMTASFLDCSEYDAVVFTCPTMTGETTLANVAAIAFYSAASEGSFISSVPILYGENGGYRTIGVAVPSNAAYMRVSIYTSSVSNYTLYGCVNFKDYRNVKSLYEGTSEALTVLSWTSHYYARGDHGGIVSSNDWDCSGYIPIKGDEILVDCPLTANNAALSIVAAVAFYCKPADDGFISSKLVEHGAYGTFKPVSVPVAGGAKYIRVNRPAGYSGPYTLRQFFYDERTYYVGVNEEYTSFTGLMLDLKNDGRRKKVLVRGGEYNIFTELKDLVAANKLPAVPADNDTGYDPSTGYFDYCVFIPENTHIIGEGYVRFIFDPSPANITLNESKTWSPINTAGTMTLENVEIYCTNGRYCIHDDPLQLPQYTGAIKKYINVTAIKGTRGSKNGTTLGYAHCFGCGIPMENYYLFDNCHFETLDNAASTRTLYFHNRRVVDSVSITKATSSRIVAKNSRFISGAANRSIYFGNIGNTGTVRIRAEIVGCYCNGNIIAGDENSGSDSPNTFDITVQNSVYQSISITDTNNQYPPKVYGALIGMIDN